MKLWCEWSYSWLYNDENLLFGITAHRHHPRLLWKGWTVSINILSRILVINYVDNYSAYQNKDKKRWRKCE